MVIRCWAFGISGKIRAFNWLSIDFVSDRVVLRCFDSPDPIHTVAEPAGQDSSRQVLRPSRGLREAQGRVRGSHSFFPLAIDLLNFGCFSFSWPDWCLLVNLFSFVRLMDF